MNTRQGFLRRILLRQTTQQIKSGSLHALSQRSAIPKSSFYRHHQAQLQRIEAVGHDFFETEEGLSFLARLLIVTLVVFGLKEGVGAETIQLFFKSMLLSTYVACSTSKLREIKRTLRGAIEIYGEAAVAEVVKRCREKALVLGVDETEFNDEMILLMMELQSGFIFTEVLSQQRTKKAWWSHVGKLLGLFKNIKSLTCDGGTALIHLAKQISCPYVCDLFHALKDIVSVFRAKFHAKRKSLLRQLEKLQATVEENCNAQIQNIKAMLDILNKGEQDYKTALFSLSTQAHPFSSVSTPKTSSTLEKELTSIYAKLIEIAKSCQIEDKYNLLERFKRRIANIAILPDAWWCWANESIRCITQEPKLMDWALHYLLPYYYWQIQFNKSKRNRALRKHYQQLMDEAYQRLQAHPLTQYNLSDTFIHWAIAMAKKYQRTSSQVEGRNGRLSQAYFNARGLVAKHLKSLTIIHNFFITRADGTTAAERLCQYKPPDLIESLVNTFGTSILSIPRNRNGQNALGTL